MPERIRKLTFHFWAADRGPYALLLFLAFTLFILAPMLSARLVSPVLLEIAFSVVLVSGAFIVSSRASVRLITVVAGLLSVFFRLLGISVTGKVIVVIDTCISVGMLSCFALLMVRQFLGANRAQVHRIAGAVAIYLLLGLIWSRMYQLVELVIPGSFRIQEGDILNDASLAYFSFVTLATLGYGDIVPTRIIARDLAVLEAIMGQLYLVILISKLVSEGSTNYKGASDTQFSPGGVDEGSLPDRK